MENVAKDTTIKKDNQGQRFGSRPSDRRGRRDNPDAPKDEFDKKVMQVDRISRTVRGGKRIRFRALVILGNHTGKVGMGVAKATEVVDAVEKATKIARRSLVDVPIVNGTIAHMIEVKLGAAHIILKPAKEGRSIVAGGTIRTICELAGVRNIVSKILGTANKINNSKATFEAFARLTAEGKNNA